MSQDWATLNESERATVSTVLAFLHKRLAEAASIDWALRFDPTQRLERFAVLDLLGRQAIPAMPEPFATAWRLIEECWSTEPKARRFSFPIYDIQNKLQSGDRSGSIVRAIVEIVAPRLEVKALSPQHWSDTRRSKKEKTFHDLLSANLTSEKLIDLNLLRLDGIVEPQFLNALAYALESAVQNGLEIARRLGWEDSRQWWKVGLLHSVYYRQANHGEAGEREPDAYHEGIAPSVKLLHAVVARIAQIDNEAAKLIIQRWKLENSPFHLRLWAAMARDLTLVSDVEAGTFSANVDDEKFWELSQFPEITELRLSRFAEFDEITKNVILKRVSNGPPRSHFSKRLKPSEFSNARRYYAAKEMKRIAIAGEALPPKEQIWLDTQLLEFADLVSMTARTDFPEGPVVRRVLPISDNKFDDLLGIARLKALEAALLSARNWSNDPSDRADNWLRLDGNALKIISDLEITEKDGSSFPQLWQRLGWAHTPRSQDSAAIAPRDLQSEANRILALLLQTSDNTLSKAIEGISAWLDSWGKQVVKSSLGTQVWLRIWPLAVEATNAKPEKEDDTHLNFTARELDKDREPMDLDTLNTPAGRLVGVFLTACPPLNGGLQPFTEGSAVRKLRDAIENCIGRSDLIARHRMIEAIDYFHLADEAWTQSHLIAPLQRTDAASLPLWRALARRTHFDKILEIIGEMMAERAVDFRLGRETRRSLVFSLVIETLHAFKDNRQPKVENSKILQMLRNLDDEVRGYAANAIQQFVRDHSTRQEVKDKVFNPGQLFRSAAAPFLKQVWPQERSLASPSVSSAFADLPVTSGEAFEDAVSAIERFLIPFDCWSMVNYGLYGEENGVKKIAFIDTQPKAKAFLHLLDLTVGNSERSVVPNDLASALDQIKLIDGSLTETPAFRRLSASARR